MSQTSRRELVQDLKERLRQIECSQRPAREPLFSTGMALDQLLPGKGLTWGTLIEWLSEEGTGAVTLALAVTARLLQRGGVFVVIDSKREFYPPAAAGLGIPLEHTVIVRPDSGRDALWALEQSLRCSAVTVALGWIGGLNDRIFRRLQLAAETGGGLGFLLRPVSCRAEPSWAEVRLLVEAVPMVQSSGRRLHVELLHCRGGAGGAAFELELSDEAGHVRLASRLAHSASPPRRAGA